MIRLVDVHKSFTGRPVLAGVGLEAPAGRVTFVVGRSGAGKSVLSRCCVGLLRVDAGEVWVGGSRVDHWPEHALTALRRRVPYVVQGPGLLDWLDLLENVALPLVRALGLPRAEALKRAERELEQVGLAELRHRSPPELGPGDCKRAAIARALALEPQAILYDEPTTGLDAAAARRVDGLIRQSASRGAAALVVSHDLDSIRTLADQVAVLDAGRIGWSGAVADFFAAADEHPAVRRFFKQGEEDSASLLAEAGS
jgi:phospholipid/cholesterol/gamma-HCH transport system ATP-binding protein